MKHFIEYKYVPIILGSISVVIIAGAMLLFIAPRPPIKIGILHSLTGPLALSEKPIIDAELLAIDEINTEGGLLGRRLIPIIADGKSDDEAFKKETERLIQEENVAVIIGGWTSASCRIMQPIIEKYDNILLYPVANEGILSSPNILFIGATQNQQIVPAALWAYYNLGKRFYIVGSEEMYSRVASKIIQEVLLSVGAEIIGDEYVLLGSTDMKELVTKVVQAKPDVVMNSIQGDSNLPFFIELHRQGVTPEKIPVMSIGSVSETDFTEIDSDAMAGDYTTSSYFQSIDTEENAAFVTRFKNKYGHNSVVSESCEAGYTAIRIWAEAVKIAQTADPSTVKHHLHNRLINAPEGFIYVDSTSLYTWKTVYVGRLRSDGQFTIVWDSTRTVQPLEVPTFGTKQQWEQYIQDLYIGWGNRWSQIAG